MARPWTLAAAFAAGLAPGLLLYWSARPQPIRALPAPAVTLAIPAPATTTPSAAAPLKPNEPKPNRRSSPDPDRLEFQTRLQTDHQEALAKLAAAEKAASEAYAKLRELEPKLELLSGQQQASQGQEKELRQQLETALRQLASLESSLKLREARISEMELAQQRTQRQGTDAAQRLQRVGALMTELEENTRRRESYLNSILGRYREATDLFRAMSLRLDNPRDVASPLNNDLSRIQTAIQHADEDLRQLRALNAQSARLQKEIATRP